jgi:hypothetical protein
MSEKNRETTSLLGVTLKMGLPVYYEILQNQTSKSKIHSYDPIMI